MGADLTLNPLSDDVLGRIEEFTDGRGADIVVESSGSPNAFLQGCAAAAGGGKIVVIGWILEACQFNMSDAFTPKGLELVVCHSGQIGDWTIGRRRLQARGMSGDGRRRGMPPKLSAPLNEDYMYLMNLMAQDKLKAKDLISHRFPLTDLVQGVGRVYRQETGGVRSGAICELDAGTVNLDLMDLRQVSEIT